MKRTYINDLKQGKEVLVSGWVFESRVLAKMAFVLIRDVTGMVQCISKDSEIIKKMEEASLESVVEIKGKVKKAVVKAHNVRKDVELEITDFKILSKAEKLPIHVNEKAVVSELPLRLDYRSLDIRKPRIKAIFKVQSTIVNSFREFFYKENFIEIQPPSIISTSTEGGTDLFEVKYFSQKAYLAQSPQLYKQLMAISLERVFSTSPVWRAEPHDTSRHINEIRQMDIECAFQDDLEVMKWLERAVQFIVKKVLDECGMELELLGVDLKIPDAVYMTYEKAVEVLKKNKIKISYGDDLEPEAERKLCEIYKDSMVFVYEWPIELKPFYIWPKDKEKGISAGFDCIYRGIEISSGGQRVHDPEVLIEMLKLKELKPKNFKWYVDSFRYGTPFHSGWSIGLERLTQVILGLDNIREATMFVRDRKRLSP